jgi:hypothetical protein
MSDPGVSLMTARQWFLSACFLGFVALKLAEALVPLDSWPWSNIPMFSRRMPPELSPQRLHVFGRRGTRWVELTSRDLSLTDDELSRRLRNSPSPRVACGQIVAANNPRLGVNAAMLMVERVPRPGSGAPPRWQSESCPLDAGPPRSPR